MSRIARKLMRALALLLAGPAAPLLRLSGRRAGVALVYHRVAERTGEPELELVPPYGRELFDAQLRHVTRTYRVVLAEELPSAVARRRRGERFPVAITFDDDLASHVRLALPSLHRHGARGTFFLTGATLEGAQYFWWQLLQEAFDSDSSRLVELLPSIGFDASRLAPAAIHAVGLHVEGLDSAARDRFADALLGAYGGEPEAGVSGEDVRTLVEAGMAIGFHTRRHHVLPTLDDASLAAALQDGRAELETWAGGRVVTIAYPHGKADERVAAAARTAGFEVGFTGEAAGIGSAANPLLLGRHTPSHRSARHLALQIVAALIRVREPVGHSPA